jgi:hypothetical protein
MDLRLKVEPYLPRCPDIVPKKSWNISRNNT